MLEDYIKDYVEARKNNNKKTMQQIERSLRQLGMDYQTLMVLVKEFENGQTTS